MNRRGTALIIVVGIVAVLTALVIHFHDISSHRLRLAATTSQRRQALSLARCGVALVREALNLDKRAFFFLPRNNPENPIENPGEPSDLERAYLWFDKSLVTPTAFEGGTLSVDLSDDMGRLSINRARTEQLATLIQGLGVMKEETTDLFEDRKLRDRSQEMACAIVDWRDVNLERELGLGAEDGDYQRLPQKYRCRNAPFQSTGELLLVRDFDDEVLRGQQTKPSPTEEVEEPDEDEPPLQRQAPTGLGAYITVFGSGYQVNVNTAPDQVLATLPGIYGSAQAAFVVEQIRRSRPIRTMAQLRDIVNAVDARAWTQLFRYITLNSNRYRVAVTAHVGGTRARVEAVLMKQGRTLSTLLWKER